VVIISGIGSIENVIEALRLGATDFLVKPVKLFELDAVLEKSKQMGRLLRRNRTLTDTLSAFQSGRLCQAGSWKMVGDSPAVQQTKAQILQMAESGCDTLLIIGETGCGKEVAARMFHQEAVGDAAPFIAVSCPAIPESIIESELYGYEMGAFTGANTDKAGYFEMADNGTLFLDEISDLSPSAQATLLRVLETRKFRHLGGGAEIDINVKIIAASNTDLEELMKAGKFRSDLYYRLAVYPLVIPPLCKRKEDIIPLAEHFLSLYDSGRSQARHVLSGESKALLMSYDYPGNIRELRNIVERAVILSEGKEITSDHIYLPKSTCKIRLNEKLENNKLTERERIINALEETKWNRKQAAHKLGIPYSTLRYKIRALDLG
jgi:DNA-binding NtrC family response regulator